MKKPVAPKKTSVTIPPAKAEVKKQTIAMPALKPEKVAKPKAPKKETIKANPIEKACEVALSKLKELNIDERLQSEIQWCLGSYQNDKNPEGLYQMAKRALAIFSVELAAKTPGVTAKLVADMEKAIGGN
jgi:hypothetical protein